MFLQVKYCDAALRLIKVLHSTKWALHYCTWKPVGYKVQTDSE